MKSADKLVERFTNLLGDDPVGKAYAKDCAILSLEETVKALNEELPWRDLTVNLQANHFLNESGNLIREYQQQIEYLKRI